MQKIFDVHIGEVKIAKNGEVLKAILGSCVGIGIIWKEKKNMWFGALFIAGKPCSNL